jgi:hypothetical protein
LARRNAFVPASGGGTDRPTGIIRIIAIHGSGVVVAGGGEFGRVRKYESAEVQAQQPAGDESNEDIDTKPSHAPTITRTRKLFQQFFTEDWNDCSGGYQSIHGHKKTGQDFHPARLF